jgi:collagenase-like PrtC family protease
MEMSDLPLAAMPQQAVGSRPPAKISLDAVAYYWPRQRVFDFYRAIAATPVDIVYLGETVCSRRHELRADDWLEIAAQLAESGKEVIFSTQALIESESDLKAMRRIIDAAGSSGGIGVEANDFGAVHLLAERKLPFVAGPSLNVFNPETLGVLAELGARRWVMPPEMSGDALRALLPTAPAGIATEAMAWGRLPLALSARCFTARHFNLQKDTCEFKCIAFPDGLPLRTREGQPFLVLNGIQTQSAKVYNLLNDLPALRHAGVDVIRICPQAESTETVIAECRRRIDAADAAWTLVSTWPPTGRGDTCNGFWHGRPGLEWIE